MTAEQATRPTPGGTDLAAPPPVVKEVGEAPRPPWWRRWLPRYTWSGTVGAVLFGGASLTPSLLPRGWVLQGLIAGITAAIGYGAGVTVAWFVAELTESRMSPGFRHRAWRVFQRHLDPLAPPKPLRVSRSARLRARFRSLGR